MTSPQYGAVSAEAAAEGDTSEGFEATMTFAYTQNDVHLLSRPLFGLVNPSDPAFSFTYSTDFTWQAKFGWTLVQRSWRALGSQLELSLEQGVAHQFGHDSTEHAWVVDFLQGGVKYPVRRSNLYLFGEVGFSGRYNSAGAWTAGFTTGLGVGIELETLFAR
ncbi:hypothetical protein [Actinophytocola xanthii]|uniref:Uncharacterized protein n=1 Tax=Actinophytocola xanthii TaxID=1912961 RepID=A0A1Q8CXZ2_9PSEU|nr:hypothetical protein [Actinophytocola xanthii]OLF19228.1 hypothetical protein BU204_02435 [Actinophytocola xanthii]